MKMKMKMTMMMMPRRVQTCLLVLLVFVLAQTQVSEAKVLALDIGSDTTKVALVQAGRNAITLVTNEMSKRKTPTKVSFAKGVRNFGEAAASLEQRYPNQVFTRFKDALGQPAYKDSLVEKLYKNSYRPFKIEIDEKNGEYFYEVDDKVKYSADELMGMMLQYFANLGKDFAGKKAKDLNDMALVIPSYYGIRERLALTAAGKVARKNILGFITTASAAALHYAKDRKFVNNTEEILFFNAGAAYSEAALIRISAGEKKSKSTKVEVLDLAWNSNAGAENLDIKLTDHFADEYNAKYAGSDLRSNPKSMSKLKAACKKTKQILSANSEAPISVESLMDDNDFRGHITRSEFESLIQEEVAMIASPLQEVLERSPIELDKLTAVELLGGGSRIPAVQAKLSEILGGRHLDRHLDGDEAAVLGAALFAANASQSFVLKKFILEDKFPYALDLDIVQDGSTKTFPLVPKMATLPYVKPLVLKDMKDDFIAKVRYSDSSALPPGTLTRDLFVYNVTGFERFKSRNLTDEVVLLAGLDAFAAFKFEKVSTHHTFEETYNETVKISQNKTETVIDTDSFDNDTIGNDTISADSTKNETIPLEEVVTKTRRIKKELLLEWSWMNKHDVMADEGEITSRGKRLKSLIAKDKERKETEALTNELESFILSTMSTVGNDEDIEKVTSEEQREELQSALMAAEDWLYGEGSQANKTALSTKLSVLKKAFFPMEERARELEDRPNAAKSASTMISSNRDVLQTIEKEKDWIEKEIIQNATKALDEYEKWLKEGLEAQAARADHEDLAIRSDEITEKKAELKKVIKKIKSIPKPKPKVEEKDEKDLNQTAEAILEDLEEEENEDDIDDMDAEAAWGSKTEL